MMGLQELMNQAQQQQGTPALPEAFTQGAEQGQTPVEQGMGQNMTMPNIREMDIQ